MAVKVDSIEEAAYIAGQAAENKRLKEENARLRAIISAPVERFGTPELVSWANRLWEILSEYPEGDRGSAAFVFTMGAHLEKFAKAWNSPTIAAKDARIADLEAMWVEERAARLWADDIVRYEGHLTWSEVDARTRSHCIEEARAALQRTGSQAAPKSEIESTLRAGLDLCHYEIDRAINQAAPSEDGDDAADIALARRARWGIVDDGAGQR